MSTRRRRRRRRSPRSRPQHRRCVWLDGGGAREWSRQRSIIGWLDEDDVSLTYDAGRREVTRHAGGSSVVVGDDPFVVLEAELAAGSPVGPVVRLLRLRRPPRPPRPPRPRPARRDLDAARARSGCSSTRRRSGRSLVEDATSAATASRNHPRRLRRGVRRRPGAPARGQLLRGQPDPPAAGRERHRPRVGVPPAAQPESRSLCGFPPAQRARPAGRERLAAELVAGALRAGDRRPVPRDQADQGHDRPRRHAGRGRRGARAAGDGPEVPRREPDDRRPAPQRPVAGVRGRHRRGPGADGGRVLHLGAPAGVDGARAAARRRHDGRRPARALPRRLDDRRPEAADDGDHRRGRGDAPRCVRRRVRLGLRRRPGRPGRRHPHPAHRRRRLPARHRRRDHRDSEVVDEYAETQWKAERLLRALLSSRRAAAAPAGRGGRSATVSRPSARSLRSAVGWVLCGRRTWLARRRWLRRCPRRARERGAA